MQGPGDSQPQLIERQPVASADQAKPVYFYVYQSLLNDGVHKFHYVVERGSGNSAPSTESWALHYDDLPGGNDVPGTGDHPNLAITLPPELGDPPQIGKDEVDNGVPLALFYSFMRPYDKIILEIGRERFEYTLQPGEEDLPYEILVTRAMFEQAGSHPELAFSYTVISQVNDPTEKRRWSKIIKANVDTERATLMAPDLSENPDDPTDDPTTIDLGNLKDSLFVLVHVFDPNWAKDDLIHVSYICTPDTGAVVAHSVDATVMRLPFTHKLEVPADKVLSRGNVSVFFEQVRGDKVIGLSKVANARVIGEHQADERPFITSVTDTKGQQIPNGASTTDITVNMVGTADENEEVEVFDGSTSKGRARTTNGIWRHSVIGLAFGTHSLTAKALYGSEQISEPPRTFTKISVEDFESIPTKSIPLGGRISTPFFDIFYAQGEPSIQVQIARATSPQGIINGQCLQPSYGRETPYSVPIKIELLLRMPCSRVTFWSKSVSAPASVEFNNAVGASLGTRTLPHIAQGSILYMTDFSAAGISKITLVTTGNDWCHFDAFTFWP
jgi:hypothetical protein